MKKVNPLYVAAFLAIAWLLVRNGLPSISIGAKPTAATLFYEKDEHKIEPEVQDALNTLTRQGLVATAHEVDTKDGTDDVPEQHKVSLPAAQAAGLPALVVMAGAKVIEVVKNPTTAEQVMEAVQ